MNRYVIPLHRRVPWTLIVFLVFIWVPWVGSRYDTFLGTLIAIDALFAVSLNLLLGTAGLVCFGHAAYFGIGSYVCGFGKRLTIASRCVVRRVSALTKPNSLAHAT